MRPQSRHSWRVPLADCDRRTLRRRDPHALPVSSPHAPRRHPLPSVDFDALLDDIAERVATKISERRPTNVITPDDPLLLTVGQAAKKLGRTITAIEHMVRSGKLKAVRIDSRVQIDYRDILALIDQRKEPD